MEAVRLRIADKYFFDNAELLLPSIKDAAGGLLEDGVNAWLTQIYNLTPKTHKDILSFNHSYHESTNHIEPM